MRENGRRALKQEGNMSPELARQQAPVQSIQAQETTPPPAPVMPEAAAVATQPDRTPSRLRGAAVELAIPVVVGAAAVGYALTASFIGRRRNTGGDDGSTNAAGESTGYDRNGNPSWKREGGHPSQAAMEKAQRGTRWRRGDQESDEVAAQEYERGERIQNRHDRRRRG